MNDTHTFEGWQDHGDIASRLNNTSLALEPDEASFSDDSSTEDLNVSPRPEDSGDGSTPAIEATSSPQATSSSEDDAICVDCQKEHDRRRLVICIDGSWDLPDRISSQLPICFLHLF